jgi:Flp pilus assembly protein TadD
MMAIRTCASLLCLAAAFALPAVTPVRAQADPAAELEAMSRQSAEVGPGLDLARRQVGNGDLTSAVATLERVLISHPEADAALLFHASLLCRLDDPAGARIEFDELRGHPIPDRDWADATAACGAAPRPPRSRR